MRASIITPTFNSLKYIDNCVNNVQCQGDVVIEHIIVDGGSTDGTVDRILSLQSELKTIRYIPGPDLGQSDALNKGIAVAHGEVIGVLNVDDLYEPDAVSQACYILNRLESPAFVVGNCKIIDSQHIKWNCPKDLRFEALILGYDYTQWPNNPSSYFYHKDIHDVVGLFNIEDHYTMDLDFIFRCSKAIKIKYVKMHWGNFYLHPGSKTFDDNDGVSRQKALMNRFHDQLSSVQRRKMMRIRLSKTIILLLKGFLKKNRILNHLNDLLRTR